VLSCFALAPTCSRPLSLARRSFNKRQEEFGSAREYNDYLEQVEDIGARRRRSCAAHTHAGLSKQR
jgi:hypothetical protein